MDYDATFETTATPSRVWSMLIDIESWPQFLSSYTSVRRLDSGPLEVGSRAEVRQPGLMAATFEVTELEEGHNFTWVAQGPGVRTEARHVVDAGETGGTRLRLELQQTGVLAGLIGLLIGRKIQRYVELEGRGLCAASEAG